MFVSDSWAFLFIYVWILFGFTYFGWMYDSKHISLIVENEIACFFSAQQHICRARYRAFSYRRHIYCGAVALPSLIASNRVSNVNIKQQQGLPKESNYVFEV